MGCENPFESVGVYLGAPMRRFLYYDEKQTPESHYGSGGFAKY